MSGIATVDTVEMTEIRKSASKFVEMAMKAAREIVDSKTLAVAASLLLESKAHIKAITDRLKDPRQKAHAAWKEWVTLEGELVEPYLRVETIIKPAMATFTMEEDRRRHAEEERLRAEAKKREEEARITSAANLEKEGYADLANRVLATPMPIPPVVIPKVEQPKGITYRDTWKFEIVDKTRIPGEYLMVDEQKIAAVVRALKKETNIPGIRVFSEKIVVGRAN